MTGKMILHIVLIVLMYAFLIWMIVRKRKLLLESDEVFLTNTETLLLICGIVLLVVNGIMLIVDLQRAAGKSEAVSIMVGCITCFLLAFFPPNNRLGALLFELFVENSIRKKHVEEKSPSGNNRKK